MKFGLVEENRREAQPGLSATCPACSGVIIAKCGPIKVWHWAHQSIRSCDHWWESETKWHRDWKNNFPKDWQEIIQWSDLGEKHIADVKTKYGLVIEFQHSYLRREEREAREEFYKRMVWIVNGRRRPKDMSRLNVSLANATALHTKPLILSVPVDGGGPLRDWAGSRAPVYFDFGNREPIDTGSSDQSILWRLDPKSSEIRAYLSPVSKTLFLNAYLEEEAYDATFTELVDLVVDNHVRRQAAQARPLTRFDGYLLHKQRRRARF